jgi:hypothetical protein
MSDITPRRALIEKVNEIVVVGNKLSSSIIPVTTDRRLESDTLHQKSLKRRGHLDRIFVRANPIIANASSIEMKQCCALSTHRSASTTAPLLKGSDGNGSK